MTSIYKAAIFVVIAMTFANRAYANDQEPLNLKIAKDAPHSIELNKVMTKNDDCVFFIISRTKSKNTLPEFRVSLGFFDKKGIIIGDLNSYIVPIHPNRQLISRFTLEDTTCKSVSRIHINEVFCTEEKDSNSCYDKTAVRSRLNIKVTR